MEEVVRTRAAYEETADAFVEKYQRLSLAARHGDDFTDALDGDRILDVGCGPGADAATFDAAGYAVTGLDLSPSLVRAAREYAPRAAFVRSDMRRLPFRDGAFDGVWSRASFLHVPRRAAPATLREFRRVLAGDGALFLSVRRGDGDEYDRDGRYFELYGPDEVRTLLGEAGFEVSEAVADADLVAVLAAVV